MILEVGSVTGALISRLPDWSLLTCCHRIRRHGRCCSAPGSTMCGRRILMCTTWPAGGASVKNGQSSLSLPLSTLCGTIFVVEMEIKGVTFMLYHRRT